MGSARSFEELAVWQAAREMWNELSKTCRTFPAEEKYRLADQLIRASRSVTANLAEGYGRFHHRENIQFCRQARGSLHEILDHLICASDEGYISEVQFYVHKSQMEHCLKIMNGYIAYLVRAYNNSKKPNT